MFENTSLVVYSNFEKRLAGAVTAALVFLIPYTEFLTLKNKNLKRYQKLDHSVFATGFVLAIIIQPIFNIILSMILLALLGFSFPDKKKH